MFALCAALLATTSCVEDKFDFSDTDGSRAEIKINNLTIPVNLDSIVLSDILKLDAGSIVKTIDGNYAVSVSGNFSSSPISIKPVSIEIGKMSSVSQDIYDFQGLDVPATEIPTYSTPINHDITEMLVPFEFSSSAVDASIKDINSLSTRWSIRLYITVTDPLAAFKEINFSNLRLRIPKGIVITNANRDADGNVIVEDFTISKGAYTKTLEFNVSTLSPALFAAGEYSFTPGRVAVKGDVGIASGHITAIPEAMIKNKPQKVGFIVLPNLGTLTLTSFTGEIDYSVSNLNPYTVSLKNLPSLLTDPSTRITVTNPQLYLSINNPLAAQGLRPTTSLTLNALRPNETPVEMQPSRALTIGADRGVDGPYTFCLSPLAPYGLEGFPSPEHIPFADLSKILEGQGLPKEIKIAFDAPRVAGKVVDFPIGANFKGIEGRYNFYAPLSFGTGSQVIYTGEEHGWNLDGYRIESLKIEADLDNALPFDIELKADAFIGTSTTMTTSIGTIEVPSGQKKHISFTSKWEAPITNLDGIRYAAKATTVSSSTLSPSTTIKLNNIRITVSGTKTL